METDLVFYGTGAAEGIPTPFCRCPVCENARSAGGFERRRCSMLRLSPEMCIDFGPDLPAAAAEWGDLYELAHVLVTHTHEDHLYHGLIETRALSPGRGGWPLNLYLTGEAFAIVEHWRKSPAFMGGKLARYEEQGVVAFHRLVFGAESVLGGVAILPLRGNHAGNLGEAPANYLLKNPHGRTIYYAVDTGFFLPETLDALAGRKLDILICECTFGAARGRGEAPGFHLDFASCLHLLRRLLESGAIHPGTSVYLTHISHKQPATHAQLAAMAQNAGLPCTITVAHDGMRIL